MATVVFQDQIEVPLDLHSLVEFRDWAASSEFPKSGRIDWIASRIEVDMSPESLYSHGAVKVELVRALAQLVKDRDLGELYTDRVRVSAPAADLSAEPDLVFLSHAAIDEARVRLVPKEGRGNDYVEVEGAPDLVIEIVSDGSVGKDKERLPRAYFAAGVQEYWLIDARGESLQYHIYGRGKAGFEATATDAQGWQTSAIFARRFMLSRRPDRRGHWQYDLTMAIEK